MTSHLSAPRSLLLVGAFFGAFTLGAAAQQPASPSAATPPAAAPAAAPALPPGSALIGRPAGSEAAAKLAPIAPPPIAAAPDKLPTAKLKVPPGFNIEVYAAGIANARSMAEGDKGTVFVGSRLIDKVYAIVNKDGKRTVKVLRRAFIGRTVSRSRTARSTSPNCRRSPRSTRSRTTWTIRRSRPMIYDNLPKDEAHGWKFIAIGPDNKLYVPVGQPGNNVLHDDAHGQIRRINLDGSGAEVIALRRSQHCRLRLASGKQAALLHRQRPRLDVGRCPAGRTQSCDEGRRALRCALLPAGQYRRPRIRLGPFLQRIIPRRLA